MAGALSGISHTPNDGKSQDAWSEAHALPHHHQLRGVGCADQPFSGADILIL